MLPVWLITCWVGDIKKVIELMTAWAHKLQRETNALITINGAVG